MDTRKRKEGAEGFGEASAAFLGRMPAAVAGPAARRIGDALILSGVADKAVVERLIRSAGRTLRRDSDILVRAERPKAEAQLRRVDERIVVPLPSSIDARGDQAAAALAASYGPALAERAATRRSEAFSFRSGPARWQRLAMVVVLLGAGAATAVSPSLALGLAVWLGCLVVAVNAALWTVAVFSAMGAVREAPVIQPDLPQVSLIVALYKEPETAGLLVRSLSRLRYPAGKLEVKLVLEADDAETLTALASLSLPSHFEILIAPPGAPRTKPRLEQYVRTEAAERLSLIRMLHAPRDGHSASVMANAIRGLVDQPKPSVNRISGLMDGLKTVAARSASLWPTRKAAE